MNKQEMSSDFHTPQRPGGLELTARLLEQCRFSPGSHLLDIGCGAGITVEHLNSQGFRARGIDRLPAACPSCLLGDARKLPFPDDSLDGVFFECSLSRIKDPLTALREACRVLHRHGLLAFSDLYAQGTPAGGAGLLGRIQPAQTLHQLMESAGFRLLWQEDHSKELQNFWARLVFEHGPDKAGQLLGIDPADLKAARPGYLLAVYEKTENPALAMDEWVVRQTGLEKPDPHDLTGWQLEKVRQSVELAQSVSPFYREQLAEINPEQIRSLTDLGKLPLMNGAVLAEQGMRLLCVSQSRVERVRTFRTSGSTGPAKRFWFTAEDLEATVDFFDAGMRLLTAPGTQVAILMSDAAPDSIADLLCRGLDRFGARGIIAGSSLPEEAAAAVAQAQTVVGLPAEVFYLSQKWPELRPLAVLLSADYIPPALARRIEATWKCKVFSHYGMTETGYGLAVQCQARAVHHLRSADFLVEVIDPVTGELRAPGQVGELVLTSLKPRAIPLIRYRTGDIGSVEEVCACQSRLPGLGRVRGRWENLKQAVNIHRLDDLMYQLDGLARYRARRTRSGLALQVEGTVEEAAVRSLLFEEIGCESLEIEWGEAKPGIPGKRRLEG